MADVDTCPRCTQPVRWTVTVGQARLAVDPEPDPAGNVIVQEQPDGTIRARILAGHDEQTGDEVRYTQHRTTCAARHSVGRWAGQPLCPHCKTPMHPGLVLIGELEHPSCWAERNPVGVREAVQAARELDPTRQQAFGLLAEPKEATA